MYFRPLPPRKETTIEISLPTIKTAEDIDKALNELLQSVATGVLTPGEGSTLAGIIEKRRASFETYELEQRVKKLEDKGST